MHKYIADILFNCLKYIEKITPPPFLPIRTTFIHKIKLGDFHYQTRIIYSTMTKSI